MKTFGKAKINLTTAITLKLVNSMTKQIRSSGKFKDEAAAEIIKEVRWFEK